MSEIRDTTANKTRPLPDFGRVLTFRDLVDRLVDQLRDEIVAEDLEHRRRYSPFADTAVESAPADPRWAANA